ncbi:MAG: cupin domain-containing protein [Parafilimonas sp.]
MVIRPHENIYDLLHQPGTFVNNYSSVKSKNMKGFKTNIEKDTLSNENFRKVLYTAKHFQLVLMSLHPNEDIGEETHDDNDQFFRFEAGHGKCIVDGTEYEVKNGDVVVIPAGARHNIINLDSATELKMYTIYAPPHHKDGIIHTTKKEAEISNEEFEGATTE